MSVIARKTHPIAAVSFHVIIMLSAWGFALVITSCLFLWLGHLLDELLGTAPKFMLGLFFLSIIGCFLEIYHEVSKLVSPKLKKRSALKLAGRTISVTNIIP